MEKEQAIEYILKRLDAGADITEISADLSVQLNAPEDLVQKFINQVARDHKSIQRNIPEQKLPDLQAENDSGNFSEAIKLPSPKHDLSSDPSVLENFVGEYTAQDQLGSREPFSNQESSTSGAIDRDALTNFVIRSIKNNQRHNDITETICIQTGWPWNEAQRFVAKIQTEHFGEISTNKRFFMVPLSIGFIIAGLLLLFWSVITLIDFYKGFSGHDMNISPANLIPLIFIAFFTSIGIITGGIFGIYKTLTTH